MAIIVVPTSPIERAGLPHVRFVDKARIVLGCIVAAWIMRQVGWLIAAPVDPDMGLTFVLNGRAMIASWVGVALLSVVTALLGTAISGRRLPEAGMLVACVGLVAMSMHGGTMQEVLAYHAGIEADTRRSLMKLLLTDTFLWAGVLLADWVAVALAYRWLWKSPLSPDQLDEIQETSSKSDDKPAGNKPGWSAWLGVSAGVLIVLNAIFARTLIDPVARGQVIGSLVLASMLVAMGVRYALGVNDSRWYALAPLAVAFVAYVLGYLRADMSWAQGVIYQPYRDLATTPPHVLVRALPVEFLAVGVAGAVLGFWSGEKIEEVSEMEE